MISQELLDKLNLADKNPQVLQVIVYNLKTKEGLQYDRISNTLKCLCGFCTEDNLIITASHINLSRIPNGYIKNYPRNASRPDNPGRKPAKAHGIDNVEFGATDSGNPTGL